MRDTRKKIISLTAAAVMLASAVSLSACGEKAWSLDEKLAYTPSATVGESNGGFAVEKDGYVYYVNGSAAYDGDNTFGDVEKGALMRISTENLKAGNYEETETVVPLLFAAQNYSSGIYIFGDYVYFATPTTDKDLQGEVLSDSLDFKRAKLDGSETMSTPFFRVDSNSSQYRFVQVEEGGDVYCLYVDGDELKSFNTETNKETVLVKGSTTFYFDQADATNPTVYYTMGVTKWIDTDNAAAEEYNQLYRVRADATATVNADEASYKVTGNGYQKEYDFDKEYLEEKNAEAKENKEEEIPYDLSDYSTYPYVNLGETVLDGIGSSSELKVTQFTDAEEYQSATITQPKGYTYTVQSYANGGVYFKRSAVMAIPNEIEALYYLADEEVDKTDWHTINGNAFGVGSAIEVVSLNLDNASTAAIYTVENGEHYYFYLSDTILYRAKAPVVKENGALIEYEEQEAEELARVVSGSTLLKIEGEDLYYRDGSNYLYRIQVYGADGKLCDFKTHYHPFAEEKIETVQLASVELAAATSWYGFEVFEDVLLYNNAQTINEAAYNYIYATKLDTAEKLQDRMDKYEEVTGYFGEVSDAALTELMRYNFRTGKTDAYEAVKDSCTGYQQAEFEAFSAHTKSENKAGEDYSTKFKDENGVYYDQESYFVSILGRMTEDDQTAVDDSWTAAVKKAVKVEEETEEEDDGLPGWAIALICVGSVLVAAGIAVIVVWQVRKARKAKHDREATAIRSKKKIDTTDDKSIDVYADEEGAETDGETPAEEPAEAAEEASDTAEEAVEEAKAAEDETTEE